MTQDQTTAPSPLDHFRQAFQSMTETTQPTGVQPTASVEQTTAPLDTFRPVQPPAQTGQQHNWPERERTAREAQRQMSRERNALDHVIATARELSERLLSQMGKTENIKAQLDGVPRVQHTPASMEDWVRTEHPWLAEILDRQEKSILSLVTGFNALVAALGGYAESVGQERQAYETQTQEALFAQLDRSYPLWQEAINEATDLGKVFKAWLDSLTGPTYVAHMQALQHCNAFHQVAPIFDAFETAHPDALQHPSTLHAGAPGGREAGSLPPAGGSAARTPEVSEVVPLSEAEIRDFDRLLREARTEQDRQHLYLRQRAYTTMRIKHLMP